MAEIRFEKVTKTYGSIKAVDDISLVAEDKEFMVLVGPSGCGKTTTLRMIAGLEQADQGDIYVADRRINDIPPKDRDVAMVFQDYALYPHMTVYSNMSFGLRLKKYPEHEIRGRVAEAAKILGIEDLLDRRPKQLSGGQRQRVAMGRAIVRNPLAFLFDEPLSNLDAKLRVQMRKELASLHERLQNTIVYVTHDQIEAMTLADKIVIMNKGRIMQIGGPMEIFDNPANIFVAGFIGSPTMNFLDVRPMEEEGNLVLVGECFRLAVPASLKDKFTKARDKAAILGIRPQHIFDANAKRPFMGGEPMEMTIDLIQPVGAEVIAYCSCGSTQMTACLTPKTFAASHQGWRFLLDMNQMHLFDKETGLNLKTGG